MKTYSRTDYIERYLQGQLKEGELWEFKVKLEKDPELARQLKLQREINETLADNSKLKLRKQLSSTYYQTQKVNTFSQWKYQIAAAVAIFILVGGGLTTNLFNSSKIDNTTLYQQNFVPDNSLFTLRAGTSILDASLENAMKEYNNENYVEAIRLFSMENDNMGAKLYSGFAYMKLSDFDNAILALNEVIDNNNNLFFDQAEYNLALCYLAIGDSKKTIEILNGIIDKQTAYSKKAKKIIKNIEEQ
jgi:tetratricopeptide (TPR) repeat protein